MKNEQTINFDWPESRRRFESLYSGSKVAKAAGLSQTVLSRTLWGKYNEFLSAPSAQAVIGTLRKLRTLDGKPVLVERTGTEG